MPDLEGRGGNWIQYKGEEILATHMKKNITFPVTGEKEVLMDINVDWK